MAENNDQKTLHLSGKSADREPLAQIAQAIQQQTGREVVFIMLITEHQIDVALSTVPEIGPEFGSPFSEAMTAAAMKFFEDGGYVEDL